MSTRKVINNNQYKKTGIALRRRRKVESIQQNDWLQSTMIPIMTVTSAENQASFPDVKLVSELTEICESGRANQKQIARECNISSTKMSQFMNGAPRKKGWNETESILSNWISQFQGIPVNPSPNRSDSDVRPNLESCSEEGSSSNRESPHFIENTAFQFHTSLLNNEMFEFTEEAEWLQFSIGQVLCSSM